MHQFVYKALVAATLGAGLASGAHAAVTGLVNGSFENLSVAMPPTMFTITDATNVPGWMTTAADNQIEVWQAPGPDASATPAVEGNRFAELNANLVSTLYQDVAGINLGEVVGWKLSHRGRTGIDTMQLTITDLGLDNTFGTVDDVPLFTQSFADGQTWGNYSGTGIVALGNTVRFAFASLATASGDQSFGNFLDAADFGVGVGVPIAAIPEPASLSLMFAGLLATAGLARRRRQA